MKFNSSEFGHEDIGPESQMFKENILGYTNAPLNPPEITISESKHVLNYSIQTGEEFALEFMRDRVNPKKPFTPNNFGDSSFIPVSGVTHTGSESCSISNVSLSRKSFGERERRNLSLRESEGRIHASSQPMQSMARAPLGCRFDYIPRYSSPGATDNLSRKLKILCSFGGRILPRPSDGRLRYVGGETHIIRICKETVWEELCQTTVLIYKETNIIKYQLPGEELDALISVSSDEDLFNMMEECYFLEDGGGSKKLRMFLFSVGDLDETHFSIANFDGDPELKYVVAVNGMDVGSQKVSRLCRLSDSSGNNLNELDAHTVERNNSLSVAELVEVSTSSFDCCEIQDIAEQRKEAKSKIDGLALPESESDQILVNELLVPSQAYGGNTKVNIPVEDIPVGIPNLDREFSSKETSNIEWMQQEAVEVSRPLEAVNPSQFPKAAENDHYASDNTLAHESITSESDPIHLSHSHSSIPLQRAFYSERIPRDHSMLLSRISKSGDAHTSYFLVNQSRSDISQEYSVAESVGKSGNGQSLSIGKTFHMEPEISDDGGETQNLNLDSPVNVNDSMHAKQVLVSKEESGITLPAEENCEDRKTDFWVDGLNRESSHSNSQPSELMGTELETNDGVPITEQGVDINDRFPLDLLSDIFSKVVLHDSSSDDVLFHRGQAGFSVNRENDEPKHWSFFQRLAGDDFGKRDLSLIDQDHVVLSSEYNKAEEKAPLAYDFVPLARDGIALNYGTLQEDFIEDDQKVNLGGDVVVSKSMNAHFDASQVNVGEGTHYDDLMGIVGVRNSNYEGGIGVMGLPQLDPTLVDFNTNSFQIIKNADIEELRELGSGTFGTVYHGKWRGSDVAIKRIKKSCFSGRQSEQERLISDFWREAVILSTLHHPNVVAFYGVVQDGSGGTLATLTEYMVDGSLRQALLRKDRRIDRRKRLVIAMDAAFGMEYLHAKNIVHFDLKCDNLLVNLRDPSRPVCKVGDFGLSKIKQNTLVSGGVRGTLPWMAPELLNGDSNKVSEKVDVFSFGIVLWEILTGEEPYANMHYGAIIGGIVNNTLRPSVPSYCDPEWVGLMEQCWAPNPATRPSFNEIASRLRTMSSSISSAHTRNLNL